MSLSKISVIFRRSNIPANPQDFGQIPNVIGVSSSGPLNTTTALNTLADVLQFGNGPGIEQAAYLLLKNGGPVYFTRSATSTASVLSSITKTYGNPVGTPVTLFGSVIIPGATNGDVLVTAKQLLVTLTVMNPGALTAATVVNVAGPAITVTLKHDGTNITETGTGLAAALNGSVAAAALMSAAAQGTGAGLAGPLVLTALDDGALSVTATVPVQSIRVLLSGNNTVFSASYAANVITITLATNAIGEPTTTASVAAAGILAALGTAYCTVATIGTGTKLLGAKSVTVLPFGSTGSATVSGTAADLFNFKVTVTRGGIIGGITPIAIIWTADNVSYSSEVLVPATGIVSLKDAFLDTGVSITISGTVDVGDSFSFSSTLPTTNNTDFLTALDAAILSASNNTGKKWGYITSPMSISKSLAQNIEVKLQATHTGANNTPVIFAKGLFATRDIAEGIPGEIHGQWVDSIINDYAGYLSTHGVQDYAAGAILFNSVYSGGRQYRRPLVFEVSGRKSGIPIHEDFGWTGRGPLPSTLAIYHDEYKTPGLDSQRFITSRTYTEQAGFFVTGSPTMGDPSDIGYTLSQWTAVLFSVARIAKETMFPYLRESLQVITTKESDDVPAGALALPEAKSIEDAISTAIDTFLSTAKSDNKPSASGFFVKILRNYNFLQTRELRAELGVTLNGLAENIIIGITAGTPN